jgi:hypothetical protein
MDRNRHRRIAFRAAAGVGLLLALIALLLAGEQRRTQAEMGAILSALISDVALHNNHWSAGRDIQIVLQREGEGLSGNWRLRGGLPFDQLSSFAQSSRTTRVSFFLSNVFSSDIQTELHLPSGVQAPFVSRRELESANPGDFQKRFPNYQERFVVSHAGLNLSKSEAILYIEHFCGGLCAGGSYVLMRKENGVWRVVAEHLMWES